MKGTGYTMTVCLGQAAAENKKHLTPTAASQRAKVNAMKPAIGPSRRGAIVRETVIRSPLFAINSISDVFELAIFTDGVDAVLTNRS